MSLRASYDFIVAEVGERLGKAICGLKRDRNVGEH